MKTKTKDTQPSTKITTSFTRTRTLSELKAEIDATLEQELIVAGLEYEAARRIELGLTT